MPRRVLPQAARPGRRVLVPLVLGLAVTVGSGVGPPTAGAQARRLVVVGDSVILGARSQMVGAFERAGWAVTFDAEINRSTLAGADAVRSRAGELTDSLVVNLGTNDAGNPATFRQRVDAVMAAAGSTPLVYWLTIREVRPYYGPANQVLRDAAERYPNLSVIDWNAATAGSSGLTAVDGLHLTPAGASSMTFLVGSTVLTARMTGGASSTAAPTTAPGPSLTPAPTRVATTAVPAAAGAPPSTAAPEPVAPASTTLVTTTTAATQSASARARAVIPTDGGRGGVLGWSVGLGLAAMVLVLALSGVWIAGWSLLRTRGSAGGAGPAADPIRDDRSARSRLRAQRIAASRSHHPTAVTTEAWWSPASESAPKR